MVILCLLVFLSVNPVLSFLCDKSAQVCETFLYIDHYLTMFNYNARAVYPENGKLYRYNVTNTSAADPLPMEDVITGDGWEARRLLVVANYTLPGPDIIVYEGQTVVIHVKNLLNSDTVTIHWHGLHQAGTPYMDGVPFVSQCPIESGQTFTYRFKAKPAGTFWYHSHVGSQRIDGLLGAFIVRKVEPDPLPEHILVIQDWNHDWDGDTGYRFMLYDIIENRTKYVPSQSLDGSYFSLFKAQSGLINGRGRFYSDLENGIHNGAPLKVFNVIQNISYRFRVINAGALFPFRISIDNHMLSVIESDGYPIIPAGVESFIINPGERFDFVINANQSINNYWIRGKTLEVTPRTTIAEAILRYEGAPNAEPSTRRKVCNEKDPCIVINCPFTYFPQDEYAQCIRIDQLRSSATDDPAPPVVEGKFKEYFLNFAFAGNTTVSFPSSVNGISLKFPTVSGISQPKEITTSCKHFYCEEQKHCNCTNALSIEHGDTVQIVLLNMGSGHGWAHPIHMHGHSFHVLKMGYPVYSSTTGKLIAENPDIDCRGGVSYSKSFCNIATWANQSWLNGNVPDLVLKNPPRKDTLIIPSDGYAVIRLKADNPGLWLFHCHIELHATNGMAMLLNESFSRLPRTPTNFPKCRDFKNEDGKALADLSPMDVEEVKDECSSIRSLELYVAVGVMSVVIFLQLLIMTYLLILNKKNKNSYDMPRNVYVNEGSTTQMGEEKKSKQIIEISDRL